MGNNVLVWTVNYLECPSTDTVVVLNNKPTPATILESMRDLCGTDETVLTGNTLAKLDPSTNLVEYGEWQVAEGAGNILSPRSSVTRVTDIPFNVKGNRYNWVVRRVYNQSFTCVDYASVTIYNNTIDAKAGDDDLICGTDYDLRASSPYPGVGEWSIVGAASAGNFIDKNNPNTKIEGLANGANVLKWSVLKEDIKAFGSYTVEVKIYNGNPSTPHAGDPQDVCVTSGEGQDMVTLNAAVPELGIGHWMTMSGTADWDEDTTSFVDQNWLIHEAEKEKWSAQQKQQIDSDVPADDPSRVWYHDRTNEWAQAMEKNLFNAKIGKGANPYRWFVEKRNAVPVMLKTWDGMADSTYVIRNITCSLYDDVVITNLNPSDPQVGEDQVICRNYFELTAVKPTYGTGLWTIDGQGGAKIADPSAHDSKVSNLAYGQTNFKWTVSVNGQCSKSKILYVHNMAASQANAGPSVPICEETWTLDANKPVIGQGHWEVASGNYTSIDQDGQQKATFSDPEDPKATVSNLIFGNNVFLWIIKNEGQVIGKNYSCTSTDSVVINYRVPDQAVAGNNQTICLDHTVMNANKPTFGTGHWEIIQGEGTIVDSTDAHTQVVDLSYGENILRWVVSYLECSTDSDVVIYSQKAEPYAGEDDVTYSDTYQLNAGNPGRLSGYWEVLGNADNTEYGGSKVEFDDPTKFNTYVRGLRRGVNTFRWVIETQDCKVFDEVSIAYKIVPTASFSADKEDGCFPLTVRFTDASLNASKYNWDFGDGTTSTIRNPSHTFQLPGNYEVRLSTPGPDGLSSDTSIYITVYDHPVASFDAAPQLVYIPEDKVHFINRSTGATEFLWNLGDGSTSTEKNPLYTYKHEGFYTVSLKVWNEYGCEADTVKESFIEARRGGFIIFPNTFAPRADVSGVNSIYGVNATFRPVYQDVETFNLQIFNRWGQLVYETKDINTGWDGRFNGTIVPEGIYTWVAKGRFLSGKEYTKSGQIFVIR